MLGVENMTGLPAGLHKLRLAAAYDARFRHLSLELQWTWAFLGILDPEGARGSLVPSCARPSCR